MKTILLYILLLFMAPALPALEKGAMPLNHSTNPEASGSTNNQTRAVVIGISDYQDPAIPDLRFADRDAEAFAAWLSSPAGGALPGTSVKTLLNAQATTGKIIAALDGLISASKAGDVAIIYFSGHGDVERVTKFQRGYWLSWDSPPTVYAAGAFSLVFLQDIITTLAEAGVQVVVVSDACRAGKLAGSEYGGAQATTAALSKQFANEIKILSCQPNEFSLEGEQWGGGRGAFSYHLLDGLYGLADQDEDDRITVKELNRYLEDHVAAETAPHRQNPLVLGDREARLAAVIPEALAQWRQQKTDDVVAFKKIDPRGFEDLMLVDADSSIRVLYGAFTAALERGDLMPTDSTVGRSANDYYELLIKEPSLADLHGLMTRNFAAALMDEGQQVINKLIKSDLFEIDAIWENPQQYRYIPLYLNRASELLGETHFVYNRLKTIEYFFLAEPYTVFSFTKKLSDSAYNEKKRLLRMALQYDEKAPYIWLGLCYLEPPDSLFGYINKIEELSPRWAHSNYVVGARLMSIPEKSIYYLKKAIEIDSNMLQSYDILGWDYDFIGDPVESQKYRTAFVDRFKKKAQKDSLSITISNFNLLGGVLWRLKRYEESIQALLEGKRKAKTIIPKIYSHLIAVYPDIGKFTESIESFEECKDWKVEDWWYLAIGGIYFYYLNDAEKALEYYMSGIDNIQNNFYELENLKTSLAYLYRKSGEYEKSYNLLKSIKGNMPPYLFALGEVCLSLNKIEEAQFVFEKLLYNLSNSYQKINNYTPEYLYSIVANFRLGRNKESKIAIKNVQNHLKGDPWAYYWLSCAFAQIGQLSKAMKYLGMAETAKWAPNPAIWIYGTIKDPLLDPLRHLPEFQAWEKRWSPPYKDYSKE